MYRTIVTALIVSASSPVVAQEASNVTAAVMSQDQIVAFNKAVADFTAGQQAQQAGDNATAVAKYDAALPAIQDAVKVQPDNLNNVNFLANALYAAAAANVALNKIDAVPPLYEESLPYWRKVVEAKPTDATSSMVLTSVLIQLGNFKLSKQDKEGASPLYVEAMSLARKSVGENGNAANRNLLLSAIIGASQTSDDPALKSEAAAMSKAMMADGTVDAVNKPAAQILAGSGK
ncbi:MULTISPECIES: hypothetical protein [unclassified Sphingobium]|uniref:hypothetical protein n=1 Tax=unclassified Sphingobium TaxID=2611147 RepID=UPI00146C4AF4|nr:MULTISPECIES: hypothetical protein [unclassified Sphingobium]NML91166.1 hypothetical protein [Sphingobium sp. TB-6]WDA36985.1 hypothetical protein PO876_01870 [Sphingobium sp. YC-XJ3]